MVNFGGYLEAFLQSEHQGNALYIVPYDKIKVLAGETPSQSVRSAEEIREEFTAVWRASLENADQDFAQALKALWKIVFLGLSDRETTRGAAIGAVLPLFVEAQGVEAAQSLLVQITQLSNVALNNTEALRKLVKKYDKQHPDQALLSIDLLPDLYSANFTLGYSMLVDSLDVIRTLIQIAEKAAEEALAPVDSVDGTTNERSLDQLHEDEERIFLPPRRNDSEHQHSMVITNRMAELDWLKRLVLSLPPQYLHHLVAHRGFHSIQDRNDRRPLENSQSAYETAWTSGFHLCECDIAITKDERLVLAHDEDFRRLALDGRDHKTFRHVSDLTFRELISMPLKSGIRPPLLLDILRSARAIGEQHQLVIEIKPGNYSASLALARLLTRHQDLMAQVAVIMSFDAVIMRRLWQELQAIPSFAAHTATLPDLLSTISTGTSLQNLAGHLGVHHRRMSSVDHFGVYDDNENLGLNISEANLQALDPQAEPDKELAESPSKPPPDRLRPKLLLLTVADPPKIPCELRVGVSDFSPIDGWLMVDHGSLDGVYLQFQQDMITEEGARQLRALSEKYTVGIWGYSGVDPDDFRTAEHLVEKGGVSFVNTDLPHAFRPEVFNHANTM